MELKTHLDVTQIAMETLLAGTALEEQLLLLLIVIQFEETARSLNLNHAMMELALMELAVQQQAILSPILSTSDITFSLLQFYTLFVTFFKE